MTQRTTNRRARKIGCSSGWNTKGGDIAATIDAADADADSTITYTAIWSEDKNNNGIPDEDEEFTVVYKKGEHGTFDEDVDGETKFEGLAVEDDTPAYDGAINADKNNTPKGEEDWVIRRLEYEGRRHRGHDRRGWTRMPTASSPTPPSGRKTKNNNGIPDEDEEFTVVYKKGEHGTFDEDVDGETKFEGLAVGIDTPAYDGAINADKNDTPQGEEDWVFVGWNSKGGDIAATIDAADADADSIITYTAIWSEDKNNNGIPDEDEEFTVVYKKGTQGTFDEDVDDETKFAGLAAGEDTPAYDGAIGDTGKPAGNDGYVFTGWNSKGGDIAATIDAADADADGVIEYTAQWSEDKNQGGEGNDIPDEDESYTVQYMKGEHGTFTEGVADATLFEDLELGSGIPAYNGEKDADKNDTPQGEEDWVFYMWRPSVTQVNAEDSDLTSVITLTALWKEDKNNNGIADDEEEFTVLYKKGEHGTFDEDVVDETKFEGLAVEDDTPAYDGAVNADKNNTPQGEEDWVFVGWKREGRRHRGQDRRGGCRCRQYNHLHGHLVGRQEQQRHRGRRRAVHRPLQEG